MSYDIRGNKVAHSDPDKGAWSYRYNALGMLVEQTDAKGQVTTMTYDVLGRMLTRTDDASGLARSMASWSYDTAAFGIGKLAAAESPNYSIVHSYDDYGRSSRLEETIEGTSFYSFSTTYDSNSRPERTVFPSGLVVRNVYNAQGYLEAVTNEGASQDHWRAFEVDERGNVVRFNHMVGRWRSRRGSIPSPSLMVPIAPAISGPTRVRQGSARRVTPAVGHMKRSRARTER